MIRKEKTLADILYMYLNSRHYSVEDKFKEVVKFSNGLHILIETCEDANPPGIDTYLSEWRLAESIYDLYLQFNPDSLHSIRLLSYGSVFVGYMSGCKPGNDTAMLKSEKVRKLIESAVRGKSGLARSHAFFALSNLAGTHDAVMAFFVKGKPWGYFLGCANPSHDEVVTTHVVYFLLNVWRCTFDNNLAQRSLYLIYKCDQSGVKYLCETFTNYWHKLSGQELDNFNKCRSRMYNNLRMNQPCECK